MILPATSAETISSSSEDDPMGFANSSPTKIAKEKEFFECSFESFSNTVAIRPPTAPITTLLSPQHAFIEGRPYSSQDINTQAVSQATERKAKDVQMGAVDSLPT